MRMFFASVAAVVLATSVVEGARCKHYLQARHAAITVTQHLAASKSCTNTSPARLLPPPERQQGHYSQKQASSPDRAVWPTHVRHDSSELVEYFNGYILTWSPTYCTKREQEHVSNRDPLHQRKSLSVSCLSRQ